LVEIHLQFLHITHFVTHWQSLLYTTEKINYQQIFSTKFFTPQTVSITSSPIKDITLKQLKESLAVPSAVRTYTKIQKLFHGSLSPSLQQNS